MSKTIFDKIEDLEKAAILFGLQWESKAQILAQIRNECIEIAEHLETKEQRDALQEEIGDLMHAVFSLCISCDFDPELTLKKALDKFEHRLNTMKAIAKEDGHDNLQGKTFNELMHYWELAKQRTLTPQDEGIRGTAKALQLWEKVEQKEQILNNVWCTHCCSACRMLSPVVKQTGKTIILEGACARCRSAIARYLE